MQTIRVSTIGLLIYLLSAGNILATPSDTFSTQSDSLSNLTNPNPNLNANLAFLFSNSAATVFTLQGLHLLVKKL
jgi:hypothetical protein